MRFLWNKSKDLTWKDRVILALWTILRSSTRKSIALPRSAISEKYKPLKKNFFWEQSSIFYLQKKRYIFLLLPDAKARFSGLSMFEFSFALDEKFLYCVSILCIKKTVSDNIQGYALHLREKKRRNYFTLKTWDPGSLYVLAFLAIRSTSLAIALIVL